MSYFPKRPYYIGITPEKSTLKIALLAPTRKGWGVKQLREVPLSSCVKPLDIFPAGSKVATALGGREVLIRPLELPLKKEKEVRSALAFQASSALPYPVDEAILDSEILGVEGGKTRLNLLAVRKSHLRKHLDWCDSLYLKPDVTTATPLALAALSRVLTSSQIPQLFVHQGPTETCCALISGGHVMRSYTFPSNRSLATEIRKVTLALSQAGRQYSFESVIVLGQVSDETLSVIEEATGKVTLFPAAPSLSLSQEKITEFGLAIGLAIAASTETNFRKKEFVQERTIHYYRRPLTLFAACVGVLSLLIGSFGYLSLSHQKRAIQSQFEALLFQEGKSAFHPSSNQEYREVIASLKESIETRPDTFALRPLVPNVSEFLSWLASHPILSKENNVKIGTLNYSIVKHPDLSHPKERYRVKVSMELKTANSQVSKLLHEALSNDQTYIDQKHELVWSTGKDGSHHISFFLKDKTRYT